MKPLSLFSPAKVNLFLQVLGKRPDGYHELASLFQAVNFGDTITLSFALEDSRSCSDKEVPLNKESLVGKTIALFRKESGWHEPLSVHIEKQIPMEAGLGGGSSNVATILWGMRSISRSAVYRRAIKRVWRYFGGRCAFLFLSWLCLLLWSRRDY